jgi:DNA-binding ferritin-like protein
VSDKPTIDERLEAVVESVELLLQQSREHSKQLEQDGDHIRALVRIAEINERT